MAKKIVRLVCYKSVEDIAKELVVVEGTPVIIPFPAATDFQKDYVAIFEVREKEEEKLKKYDDYRE